MHFPFQWSKKYLHSPLPKSLQSWQMLRDLLMQFLECQHKSSATSATLYFISCVRGHLLLRPLTCGEHKVKVECFHWMFKDVFATFYHVLRILSSFIRKRFIVTIGNTVSRSKSSENKLLFFANFLMWSSDMSSKEIGKNLTIINLYHSKHVISCLRCSIWENDTFRILFVSTIA